MLLFVFQFLLGTINQKISSSLYVVTVWIGRSAVLKNCFPSVTFSLTYKHSLYLMYYLDRNISYATL